MHIIGCCNDAFVLFRLNMTISFYAMCVWISSIMPFMVHDDHDFFVLKCCDLSQ